MRHISVKEGLALAAVSMVAGAGVGTAVEVSNVNVAKGRVITAETCLKTTPHNNVISQALLNCLQSGVPGGSKSGPGFHDGEPIEYVESFQKSEQEQTGFDAAPVVVCAALAPFAVAGAIALFAD